MSCADEAISTRTSIETTRRIGLSWPMLLGAAAVLAALVSGAVRIGPDTYWHIAAGRWILTHGYVPSHDIFSFTMRGAPWVAQEWGAELLMAAVYGAAGWAGSVLLVAMLFGLTIAYVARFLLSRMEPLHAVVLTTFAGCMMFSYLLVRPQELAWPLTALWVGVLIESNEENQAPPWWLLGVMLLWANVHGSYILGLALAVVIGIEAIVNAKTRWKPVARRWGAFIAAAFGCVLLNPQGWRLLIFPFQVLGMHVLDQVSEWQPSDLQYLQVFGLWLIAVFALAFAGRFKLPPARSVLLIGLIFFALQHVRNVSLLGLISPFLIAAPLAALWRRKPTRGREAQVLDRVFHRLAAPGSLRALGATIVLMGALGTAAVSVVRPKPPVRFTPRAALDALLARRPNARILNDYIFGGYLIFRGVPVFVDGRADMYGEEFLQTYFDAMDLAPGGEGINALVDKYRINALLIEAKLPVVRLLNRLPDWKQVYADKVAVVYVRKGAKS